ncbi:MAG: GNAT family N-acetyltransferase [Acidimicrobiales bacterium]|nr:GNAT family N-acetyltransferase [Acidimicrobiales bacterium]MCB1014177.1 GNAT family N-acetyltransferase [Acidimicrobiales bacterium]MCB9371997.1 GNAT family N-acetyltransferase [Microthrixaceae bacterium]
MADPADLTVRSCAFADLEPRVLHDLLRLRCDVFVVEQDCPYPDIDGRDAEPGARHFWVADGEALVACLRRLADPDGVTRIGRIATRADRRGQGLAAALVAAALDGVDGPAVLDAQSQMVGWYARFGFAPDGPEFVEDGIPHVPMRRPAPTDGGTAG